MIWDLIRPFLPAQKPWTGRLRCNLRKTFNGILYVHKTGINWSDVPRMYGAKSTVHKLHLELCEMEAYQKINDILLSRGYYKGKIDISCCNIDTKDVIAKKGKIGYDGNKKVKGSKISTLTDKNGLTLSIFISPANIHDSKLYLPTIDKVKIKLSLGAPITRPKLVNADAAYDTNAIREYNKKRGIKSNIPVNA